MILRAVVETGSQGRECQTRSNMEGDRAVLLGDLRHRMGEVFLA